MYGKTPEKIEISFPIKGGAVTSVEKMQSLVNCIFLDLSREYGRIKNAVIYLALSSDQNDLEKKAFYDAVDSSFIRPKKVVMIDKPIADALGCGIDYNSTGGIMVVNIGAQTTEVSVLFKGTIVISRLFAFGGKNLDNAVADEIRNRFKLKVGDKTAEVCKKRVVNLETEKKSDKIYGMNVVTGLPMVCKLDSEMIRDRIISEFNPVIDAIKSTLERTPPEISADIMKNGIILTGGTSLIPGIEDIIEDGVGMSVSVAKDCRDSVINGLGRIIEEKYIIEQ